MNPHQLPTSASAAAPESESLARISPAKQTANQANAQLSTGPKSSEGKAKSSLNAPLSSSCTRSSPTKSSFAIYTSRKRVSIAVAKRIPSNSASSNPSAETATPIDSKPLPGSMCKQNAPIKTSTPRRLGSNFQ